jgi:hypothetical protein
MSIGQDRAGFVYVIQDGSGLCKIGRAKNVEKRIRSLSTGSSSDLTLIASWPCSNAGEYEAILHQAWRDVRVRGEWFRIPDDVLIGWKKGDGLPGMGNGDGITTAETASFLRDQRGDPEEDGGWWISKQSQQIKCPQCGRETEDYPGVMRYVKAADHGGMQARCYPKWPALGWVVWRQCEHCSWMDFETEYVTLETIRAWGIGPWRPMP